MFQHYLKLQNKISSYKDMIIFLHMRLMIKSKKTLKRLMIIRKQLKCMKI